MSVFIVNAKLNYAKAGDYAERGDSKKVFIAAN
jgi:hypothetical protein